MALTACLHRGRRIRSSPGGLQPLFPLPLEQRRAGDLARQLQVPENVGRVLVLAVRFEGDAELGLRILRRTDEDQLGTLVVQKIRRIDGQKFSSRKLFPELFRKPGRGLSGLRTATT